MRFSNVLVGLSACLVRGLVVRGDGDDLKVPGDSPLELCPGEHNTDLVTIEKVDLSPNPPKA